MQTPPARLAGGGNIASGPERLGALFALLGWFTTHFDVAFDNEKEGYEGAKNRRLFGDGDAVRGRSLVGLPGYPRVCARIVADVA